MATLKFLHILLKLIFHHRKPTAFFFLQNMPSRVATLAAINFLQFPFNKGSEQTKGDISAQERNDIFQILGSDRLSQ